MRRQATATGGATPSFMNRSASGVRLAQYGQSETNLHASATSLTPQPTFIQLQLTAAEADSMTKGAPGAPLAPASGAAAAAAAADAAAAAAKSAGSRAALADFATRFPPHSVERTVAVLLASAASTSTAQGGKAFLTRERLNAFGRTAHDIAAAYSHQIMPEACLAASGSGTNLVTAGAGGGSSGGAAGNGDAGSTLWDRILHAAHSDWDAVTAMLVPMAPAEAAPVSKATTSSNSEPK